ncbi:MAG: GIY-YIG nuclease family protein [Amoebophilaceae bacterium]|nr:GIY-YIG nuclease family protein [Amoebophilaceae bacterium]
MDKNLCKSVKCSVKKAIDEFNLAKGASKPFTECIEKTGVYIFFENRIPVYIGESGSKKQDLKTRIYQHTQPKNSGATLRKNICKIDSCTDEAALNKIKNFTIKVIICGTATTADCEKAKNLETKLIGIFNPKYNQYKY